MLFTLGLTLVLVAGCGFIHYEVLSRLNGLLPRAHLPPRIKVLAAIAGAICSHVLQIAIFAAAYYFIKEDGRLGGLEGEFENSPMGYLYFSMQTYATLGYGEIYPSGWLRMLAGMEALTGLLMIGWTASFTYLEMSRYWPSDRRG